MRTDPEAITQKELFLLPALCRLATYAVDAQRVLGMLSAKADLMPALREQLHNACEDWRNPDHDGLMESALVTVQCYIADRIDVLAASHDVEGSA